MEYNVYQTAQVDECETQIYLDYMERTVMLYTTHAVTIRRLLKRGFDPSKVWKYRDGIDAAEFTLNIDQMGGWLKKTLFMLGRGTSKSAENTILTDDDDLDE